MAETGRRSILKALASLPAISWLSSAELFGKGGNAVSQKENGPEFIAVQILRHINTAQNWHRGDQGHYADLAALTRSEAMARMLSNERVDRLGLGKSLHEQLRIDDQEIVPGWKCTFAVADDRMHYVIVLNPTEKKSLLSMSTDERGVIYYGKELDFPNLTGAERAPRMLGERNDFRDRAVSFLRGVAFAFASCTYCQPFPCNCFSCCCISDSSGCSACDCTNCGCTECVWCLTCGCAN